MAEAVRIVGHKSDRDENEMLQAQVDTLGNLHVREGTYPGLNQTYEDASFVTGDSPVTCDFYTDSGGKRAVDGYIICDGPGSIQVDYSRDGLTYGAKWTMKTGERVNLLRLDIQKIRVTWVSNSSYRINLI
jgi:formylmethanofuran dehydrogenase subunit A